MPATGLVRSVAAAYTAAHGHPAEHDTLVESETHRRRWSVGLRVALGAVVVLLVVAGTVVVRDLRTISVQPVSAVPEVVGTGAGAADREGARADDGADVLVGEHGGSSNEASGAEGGGGSPGTGAEHAPAGGRRAPGDVGTTALVHVVGQVHAPGVVEVPVGARVHDAVLAAGGLTAGADAASVNLARQVVDGEQVYVPAPGEVVPAQGGPAGTAGDVLAGEPGRATASPGLVDLNTAGSEELQTLPGVGPALAQRILDWRVAHGTFRAVDQLRDVSGIGPVVLDGLRELVTV